MPDPTFSGEQADISRFGIREFVKPPERSAKEIVAETRAALSRNGFKINEEKNERPWLGFSSKNSTFNEETWKNFADQEKAAVADNRGFPKDIVNTFRVCIDIDPNRLPQLVDILGEQFRDISFVGEVAVTEDLFTRENHPKVVLYIKGDHLNEVFDFSISLAKSVKRRIGGSTAKLIKAKEVEEGSGVFLTQGSSVVKVFASEQGKSDQYYSPDEAVFLRTERDFDEHLQRRKNQFLIEENLVEFSRGGYKDTFDRICELQEAAFVGLQEEKTRGLRITDVRVGKYYPPTFKELPALIKKCDGCLAEIFEDERFEKDQKYANRAVSLAFVLYILIHPLTDGNGQSTTNMLTSLLFEAGQSKYFVNNFLDGEALKTIALSSVESSETPTMEERTKPRPGNEEAVSDSGIIENQGYAADMLNLCLEGTGWFDLKAFVQTGSIAENLSAKISGPWFDQVEHSGKFSILTRANNIFAILNKVLSDKPVGDRKIPFGEMQEIVERTTDIKAAI